MHLIGNRIKRESPPEDLELPPISSDGPHPLISGGSGVKDLLSSCIQIAKCFSCSLILSVVIENFSYFVKVVIINQ